MKGIDPKAREIAKDLARRSNMTLGDWLNQMILEDMTGPDSTFGREPTRHDEQEPAPRPSRLTPAPPQRAASDPAAVKELSRVTAALERLASRMESAEHRSTQAISGIDQSVHGLISRLEGAERDQASATQRLEGAVDDVRADQEVVGHRLADVEQAHRDHAAATRRLEEAVDDVRAGQDLTGRRVEAAVAAIADDASMLGDRIARVENEVASPRALEPLKGLESALGKVAAHLYDSDSRARDNAEALRGELQELSEHVAQLEIATESRLDRSAVENVVQRMVHRLEGAEARTSDAIRGLETSFADLDRRLRGAEDHGEADERLDKLAVDLQRNFEDARNELAQRLQDTADTRLDAVERSLREMTGHIGDAERRSAGAIERMGHEVLRIAGNLNQRMEGVETRSTQAIEKVGGDVRRIADTVEERFQRADALHAQSLEKLGGEITRITERLAERIGNSERRSAQAIDDVGEQMTRISDRISQRQERTSSEIADRIRQSEERTARLLEEARERIDQRLAENQRRQEESAAAARQAAADVYRDDDLEPGPFGPAAAVAARATPPPSISPPTASSPVEAPAAKGIANEDPFAHDDFAADDDFGASPFGAGHDPFAAFPEAVEPATATAADVARAHDVAPQEEPAAFPTIASGDDPFEAEEFGHSPFGRAGPAPTAAATQVDEAGEGDDETPTFDARPSSTRDLIERARAAARAASSGSEAFAPAPQPAKGGSSLFSGFSIGRKKKQDNVKSALLMSAAGAGLGLCFLGYTVMNAGAGGSHTAKAKASGADSATPIAALAVGPASLPGGVADAGVASPAANPQAAALYADAARRIDAKDFTALPQLRRAAAMGDPSAQFYLAGLYEDGGAGVHKNLVQAREWTERAAQGGDRKAMHNLALYYFHGEGGPKNATAAAQWFRHAAELGMTDSQYNLATLYEGGLGVGQNPAEAYKWYLIAARSGDAESQKAASRVGPALSADARATAQRAAQAFHPGAPTQILAAATPASPAAPGASDVLLAQKALSQLGYYRGPQDGAASPALKMAIAAYQKEQGLPATGAIDPALATKLTAIAG